MGEVRSCALPTCQLLTVRDVADLLKIHVRSVWRQSATAQMGEGEFPRPLRLGEKTIRWRLLDVEAYIAKLAGDGQGADS